MNSRKFGSAGLSGIMDGSLKDSGRSLFAFSFILFESLLPPALNVLHRMPMVLHRLVLALLLSVI